MLTAFSSFRDSGPLVGDLFRVMKNLVGLVICSRFAPVLAYDNGQFRQFYGAGGWDIILQDLMHGICAAEWTELQADPGRGGWVLVSCILENFSEIRKTEMAIVSVVLGLLPMALQFVGPKVADIAILGMQRPVLAALICLGSSCPTLESDRSGLETVRSIGHAAGGGSDDILWPDKLNDAPLWAKALISGFEYILVGTAAANSVIQGWQLSFWAISFISTLVGTYGNTAEGFSPLLWVFLPLPIQALGMCVLYLGSELEGQSASQASSQHPLLVAWCPPASRRVREWLIRETTPLAFTKNGIGRKKRDDLAKGTRYWMLILDWAIRLLIWVQVLYGTMVLSSELFLSLFTALEVVGRFLAGAMVCRVVLEFEMYGLREVSKIRLRSGR